MSELVTAGSLAEADHDLPAIEVRDLEVQYTVRLDSGKLGADLRHRGAGLGDSAGEFLAREERAHATSQMSRMASM